MAVRVFRPYPLLIMMSLFLSPYLARADFSQEFLDFLDASHISSTKVDTEPKPNGDGAFDCRDFPGYQDPLTLTQDQYLYKTIFIDDQPNENEKQEITLECINKKAGIEPPKILGYYPSNKFFSCKDMLLGGEAAAVWFDRNAHIGLYSNTQNSRIVSFSDTETILAHLTTSDGSDRGWMNWYEDAGFKNFLPLEDSIFTHLLLSLRSYKTIENSSIETPLVDLTFTRAAIEDDQGHAQCMPPQTFPIVHISHQGRTNVRLHEMVPFKTLSELFWDNQNNDILSFMDKYKNHDTSVRSWFKNHIVFQVNFPSQVTPSSIGNVILINTKTGDRYPGIYADRSWETRSIAHYGYFYHFDMDIEPDTTYKIEVEDARTWAKITTFEPNTTYYNNHRNETAFAPYYTIRMNVGTSCSPDAKTLWTEDAYMSSRCHQISLSPSPYQIHQFKTALENEFYSLNIGDPDAPAVSP